MTDPAQMPVTEARHPEPKIATVRAPRGGRPASRDARRLARAWRARQCARPTGASQAPVRLSALRHPLNSGVAKPNAKPGRKNAPRERDGLFDIVSRVGEGASWMLACVLRSFSPRRKATRSAAGRINAGNASCP